MKTVVVGGLFISALAPGGAFGAGPERTVILEYMAPTSGVWGPSLGAPPTFAFGKPAEVRQVVRDGYHVRQEVAADQAMEQARYVSQQVGHPIAVIIPDPAGGPPRIEYVGNAWGDVGK